MIMTLRESAQNFRRTRVLQGKWSDGETVRPASRERLQQAVVAATPLSVSAVSSASLGPEALRHRLATVLPLFDGMQCAAVAQREISGSPASTRGCLEARGLGWRIMQREMRDTRHASAHSGSVKPC